MVSYRTGSGTGTSPRGAEHCCEVRSPFFLLFGTARDWYSARLVQRAIGTARLGQPEIPPDSRNCCRLHRMLFNVTKRCLLIPLLDFLVFFFFFGERLRERRLLRDLFSRPGRPEGDITCGPKLYICGSIVSNAPVDKST